MKGIGEASPFSQGSMTCCNAWLTKGMGCPHSAAGWLHSLCALWSICLAFRPVVGHWLPRVPTGLVAWPVDNIIMPCACCLQQMLDWLGQLLGIPSKFLYSSGGTGGGVIQVSAC